MSILQLLTYDYSIQNKKIAAYDPRIKLTYSVLLLCFAIIIDQVVLLCVLLIFSALPIINLSSTKNLVQIISSFKLFILIYLAIRIIFASFTLTYNFPISINFRYDGLKLKIDFISEIIKVIIIIFAFYPFNKTTSPEQITDLLLKLRIPSGLAWSIGASIRQANFLIEDTINLREIQNNRRNSNSSGIKIKINEIYSMLVSIFSRSIIISDNYASTLISRQWTRPHREIILEQQKLTLSDLIAFIILILAGLIIYFLNSSEIYI